MSETKGQAAIDTVLREERVFPPPDEFSRHAHVPDRARYDALYQWSVDDPEGFWREMAGRLRWMTPFKRVLDWQPPFAQWFVGGNEAGMLLGHDVRGAEAGVWRRDDPGRLTGGYMRVPPILAVEVAGREEGERELRTKARWYLEHGVQVMWLVLPKTREVVVMRADGEERYGLGDRLAADVRLPGLEPAVSEFFDQLD